MKVLHILRSEPEERVRTWIAAAPEGVEPSEVPLFESEIDYGQLVEQIFASDKVICWW